MINFAGEIVMLDRDLAELYVIKVTKCEQKELEVTNCDIKFARSSLNKV